MAQVSVRLLPLARAVRWTRLARQQLFADTGSASLPLVLFAASFNFNKVLHEMQIVSWPHANGTGSSHDPWGMCA